jgi:type IV secretion system protein VirB6
MFTWLGVKLTAVMSVYVLGVVSSLMTALAPIALTAMTLWVLLYGWAVLRNEVSETVPNFLWKVTKIGLILAFALQSGFYITNVADTANSLATGVATTFLPSIAPVGTITSPYSLLDTFNDKASNQVADIMKEASITRLDLLVAAAVFSIGSVAFLCITVFVVTLATVFLNFVIAVGPLFIFCLAWKPTQRFFDSWLSMALNAIVLTWFAFFALGLSTYIGQEMFKAINDGGGFLGGAFNVLGEATRYCVLMLVMAIICFQAPSLASALTGGAAIQQGIQMIQSAMMVSSLRSSSGRSGAAGSGGGTMRSGAGIPHAAGYAVGAAGGLARQGYGQARVAAYKLAALRGRS